MLETICLCDSCLKEHDKKDRYLVIVSKKTGEKFRLAPKDMPVPNGFAKITSGIPIPESLKHYWELPIYNRTT